MGACVATVWGSGSNVFGEEVVFFDQPVHLEPVVEAVFVAGIMRAGVRSFLDV